MALASAEHGAASRVWSGTERTYPLSSAQERMWLLQSMDRASSAYNTVAALRLTGALNSAAMRDALHDVVARHESLRTTVRNGDGSPMQVVHEGARIPLHTWTLQQAGGDLEAFVSGEVGRPFDLEAGPLLRAHLVTVAASEHVLIVVLHHIIGDGWSRGLFFRDLAAFYAARVGGTPAKLAELPVQYGDYARWEREQGATESYAAELDYWKTQLAGVPQVLELPNDFLRSQEAAQSADRLLLSIDTALAAEVRGLARKAMTTPFVVLLAAFQVVLMRFSRSRDLLVASPVAGRLEPELQHLIGNFTNTLLLRARFRGGMSFFEFLRTQHEVCMGALGHQTLPFEQLVNELNVARDVSRQPLAQVAFSFQRAEETAPAFPGFETARVEFDGGATSFDAAIILQDRGATIEGSLKYRSDLYLRSTMESLAGAFLSVLRAVVCDSGQQVDRIPIAQARTAPRTIVEAHSAGADWYFPGRLERWARLTPEAPAVSDGERNLLYGELDGRANQLAQYLVRHGVRPDEVVAIAVGDPMERVVAMVAVMKAGACFLPLDNKLPPDRVAHMMEDATPRLLLSDGRGCSVPGAPSTIHLQADHHEIESELAAAPAVTIHPEQLVYVVFTSGSTGRPKGAMTTHGGLARFMDHQRETFAVGPGDRVLQFASPSFDASVFEFTMALAHGATLHVFQRDEFVAGDALLRCLRDRGITHSLLVPSVLATLRIGGEKLALRCMVSGAETLTNELAREWGEGVHLYNAYGPSECTIYATIADLSRPHERITIGEDLPSAITFIVDEHFEPVPVGVPGEILIGGPALGRGYCNRPDLTAERFIPDCFSGIAGARLYRTGDIGKRMADGTIDFLGRLDQQIKIRGFRVELGEIESVLASHTEVRDCVVIAATNPAGLQELRGYVRPASGAAVEARELREFLKRSLPDYMIPASIQVMDEFPRTTSGKPDRKALLRMEAPQQAVAVPAREGTEAIVAAAWANVFQRDAVGRDDNFFDIGGNSLLLVRVQADLKARLGREVSLLDMFRYPTVASLASCLDGQNESRPAAEAAARGTLRRESARRASARRRGEQPATSQTTVGS